MPWPSSGMTVIGSGVLCCARNLALRGARPNNVADCTGCSCLKDWFRRDSILLACLDPEPVLSCIGYSCGSTVDEASTF